MKITYVFRLVSLYHIVITVVVTLIALFFLFIYGDFETDGGAHSHSSLVLLPWYSILFTCSASIISALLSFGGAIGISIAGLFKREQRFYTIAKLLWKIYLCFIPYTFLLFYIGMYLFDYIFTPTGC